MCVREEARYTIVLAFTTLPYLGTVLYSCCTIGHRLCSFLVQFGCAGEKGCVSLRNNFEQF